jgi:LysM repeat protein
MMKHPLRALGTAGLLLASSVVAVVAGAGPARADTQICDRYGSTVQNRYVVMNNLWGAGTAQCLTTTNSGFAITNANHNKPTNGAPVSYTAIYLGCHYGNCSPGTNLPLQVGQIGNATSNVSFSYAGSGVYNAAYDIWLDPTPKRDGENKLELMIWLNKLGPIHPYGERTGSATVGGRTWEVWTGNAPTRRVVSYVAPSPLTSLDVDVLDFVKDVKTYSNLTESWYLTSIQAGFEPWVGGAGLAVNSFAAEVNGGGGSPRQATPGQTVPQPQPGGPTQHQSTPATPTTPVTPTSMPAIQATPSAQANADGRTYVVRAGDTLWSIAERNGVKGGWRTLYRLNRNVVGADPDLILPGQQLTLR